MITQNSLTLTISKPVKIGETHSGQLTFLFQMMHWLRENDLPYGGSDTSMYTFAETHHVVGCVEEPETVEAILAGNYDFDPLQRTAGRVEPRNEKAQQAIADQQSKFQEENRAALAKKAATDKAKEKWSARAEMLTDEEIAELDRKYPESIIASLKKSADEPGAHHLRRKILISALCWCLELEHGKQVV